MYCHVQLVTILRKSGFQRSAHVIHCNDVYIHMNTVYVLSTPLKTRFPQDRDQLYMTVHSVMYWFMSVYSSIIL